MSRPIDSSIRITDPSGLTTAATGDISGYAGSLMDANRYGYGSSIFPERATDSLAEPGKLKPVVG